MENAQLKKEMMALWKETFNDSDDYISLVFNGYFNPDYVEYEERDGHIVAALLGVPYQFTSPSCSPKESSPGSVAADGVGRLSGLYLCGLATKPAYRRQGIMSKLLKKINKKAYTLKFDFSFLIPASEELSDFYFNLGYVDCFKRVAVRYSSAHNFFIDNNELKNQIIRPMLYYDNRNSNLKLFVQEVANEDIGIFDDLRKLLDRLDSSKKYVSICQNINDLKLIIKENLIGGGRVVVAKTVDDDSISAIVIFNTDENGNVIIPHIYSDSLFSEKLLLQYIKQEYINSEIIQYKYPDDVKRKLVWNPFNYSYTHHNNDVTVDWDNEDIYEVASHPENYGMALLLRASEILKFRGNDKVGHKFSILVKDVFSNSEYIYIKDEGGLHTMLLVGESADMYKVKRVEECDLSLSNDNNIGSSDVVELPKKRVTRLSMTQLAEIIWRNRQVKDFVEEAFSIPRIPINMSYMLD